MRWKITRQPQSGDERTKFVFAWRPTKVGDYIVFLERFQILEKYIPPFKSDEYFWLTGWIEMYRTTCDYY